MAQCHACRRYSAATYADKFNTISNAESVRKRLYTANIKEWKIVTYFQTSRLIELAIVGELGEMKVNCTVAQA